MKDSSIQLKVFLTLLRKKHNRALTIFLSKSKQSGIKKALKPNKKSSKNYQSFNESLNSLYLISRGLEIWYTFLQIVDFYNFFRLFKVFQLLTIF